MENESTGPVTAKAGTESAPTRILPALADAGNQRVLIDWLEQQDQYETVVGDDAGLPDADFDMVILDDRSLRKYDTQIQSRKADAKAFLPVLLVSSDSAVDTIKTREQSETEREIWEVVDETLTSPIENAKLRTRLDTLTRIRTQSIALKRTTDQLLLLNRITRHDIRNEMSIIMGWTEQLDKHTDEAGDEIRQRVLDSSQHVVDLTKAVREFIETLQTAADPDLQAIDLGAVLSDELTKRRSTFDDTEFVVTGEIPSVRVFANDLLASVFRNLLNNAVQHNDSETPHVEITAVERDETVVVTIADNGPGIPPDRRDAVLGRTDQGLDHPAAGLGLYLVDTLITQYGGTLQMTEADAGGVAIDIELLKESAQGATQIEEDCDDSG